MKVGDLFSGIGGFSLAARWMGWRTLWFSEIDPYASRVLAKHWPDVPNLGDITAIDWTHVERPDLLCGGFPCQDISNAGKRAGIDGDRSGLWREYARAIRELRPRYVVVENVAALLGRGLDRVLGDLAEIRYDAEWRVLSAADVGAPHRRERVWIVAYPYGSRGEQNPGAGQLWADGTQQSSTYPWATNPPTTGEGSPWAGWWEIDPADMADTNGERGRRLREFVARLEEAGQGGAHTTADGVPRKFRDAGHGTGGTEPNLGRVADGVPSRVDRLRSLGNAIVPQCALEIFRAIEAAEAREVRAA